MRSLPRPSRRRRVPPAVGAAVFVVVAALGAACGSSEPKRDDGASAAAPAGAPAPAATTTPDGKPACPMEGDWRECAVEDRLLHSGVVYTKKPEPVRLPFLSVPGTAYEIGNPEHEVLVFLYPSAAERERETSALDSASASPPGQRHAWRTPPTLVTSNNLAAVILSLNDRTIERLALALGAGLPQPEKR